MSNFSIIRLIMLKALLLIQLGAAAQTNVTLGNGAGSSITTGNSNTLIGADAGNSLTFGSANTFIGWNAGMSNTTSLNTFIGTQAGTNNTIGTANTFLGSKSGLLNVNGGYNVFMGSSSGSSNTEGSYNVFIGNHSGQDNTTGDENTFIGSWAGRDNTSGHSNVFIGRRTGYNNSIGDQNTFIGERAGYHNTTGENNTFGGLGAGRDNTSGDLNAFWGISSGLSNLTGDRNTFLGPWAGYLNTYGNNNTYVGHQAGGYTNNQSSTAIGDRAYVYGSNRLSLGSVAGVNGATTTTNVGVANYVPSYRLHVGSNSAAKPGSNTWTISSDRRLKEGIIPFTEGLDIISQINPVRFHYNGKANTPTHEEFVGIIAQDIQKVAPYMVGEYVHEDTTGKQETYLDYDGNAMTYLLINSVKELKIQNELLKTELQELRKALDLRSTPQRSDANPRRKSSLLQNYPNPANDITTIAFIVPIESKEVHIRISTIQGQVVKDQLINQRGKGEIQLHAQQFAAGTYVYQLIIDGKIIESKRMILNSTSSIRH